MNQNTSPIVSKYSSGEYCLDWIMVKQAWSFFSCSLGHVGFEFPDQAWKHVVLIAGLPGKSQEWPC